MRRGRKEREREVRDGEVARRSWRRGGGMASGSTKTEREERLKGRERGRMGKGMVVARKVAERAKDLSSADKDRSLVRDRSRVGGRLPIALT